MLQEEEEEEGSQEEEAPLYHLLIDINANQPKLNVLLLFVPVGGRWQGAGRRAARYRVDPESGARGASASSG